MDGRVTQSTPAGIGSVPACQASAIITTAGRSADERSAWAIEALRRMCPKPTIPGEYMATRQGPLPLCDPLRDATVTPSPDPRTRRRMRMDPSRFGFIGSADHGADFLETESARACVGVARSTAVRRAPSPACVRGSRWLRSPSRGGNPTQW